MPNEFAYNCQASETRVYDNYIVGKKLIIGVQGEHGEHHLPRPLQRPRYRLTSLAEYLAASMQAENTCGSITVFSCTRNFFTICME